MKLFAIAAVLIAAFTSTGIKAQSLDVRANIPFAFRVGQVQMPAGEYVIHEPQPGVLQLREAGGRHAVMTTQIVGKLRTNLLDTGEVEFHRYGGTYFLAEVWRAASDTGIVLLKSPRETELARQFGFSQRARIALERK